MSVLKEKRGEQKLGVLVKAKTLMEYILEITKNDKTFAPAYEALTLDIIHCAEDIYINLYSANEVYLSKSNIELRKEYQNIAQAKCGTLLALLDLAQGLNHFPTKKIRYVNKIINGDEKDFRACISEGDSYYSLQRMDKYYLSLWKGTDYEQREIQFIANLRAKKARNSSRKSFSG